MLPFVIKICVLSIFEWPLKTGFTVCETQSTHAKIFFRIYGTGKACLHCGIPYDQQEPLQWEILDCTPCILYAATCLKKKKQNK